MGRSGSELIRTIDLFIRKHRLMEQEETLLVAVSGGPDSTALLHILNRLSTDWKWTLTAAHLNHQFRGSESDQEAELVESYCRALGIPCEIGAVDMPQLIRQTGQNSQAASREQRYKFLSEAAGKLGASRLVTAHHADDQAETLLMRIIRGTGPSGLTGIPLRRTLNHLELVRPLLRIYKSELLSYCHDHALPYAEDSSNRSRKYIRNRIRLDMMPALTEYNPLFSESLNRLADLMLEEDHFIVQETNRVWTSMVTVDQDGCVFSRNEFTALHIALQRRLIHLILSYVCVEADASDFNRIERIRELITQDHPPSVMIHLQGGALMRREYDSVYMLKQSWGTSDLLFQADWGGVLERSHLDEQGATRWAGALSFFIQSKDTGTTSTNGGTIADGEMHVKLRSHPSHLEAFFDLNQVSFPLSIRKRRDGDRMQPLGLNGSKKVKDMFIDKKIPQRLRELIPIVEDATGRLLWIPGVGRSMHAVITPETSQVMVMRYIPFA